MSEKTSESIPSASILQVSAFDPEARVDPHPRLKALREHGRVLRDGAAWAVSRGCR